MSNFSKRAVEQVAEPDFLIAPLLKSRLAPAFDDAKKGEAASEECRSIIS